MKQPPQHFLAGLAQAIAAANLLRIIANNPKLTTPEGKEVCLQAADSIDEQLTEIPILVVKEACRKEDESIATATNGETP